MLLSISILKGQDNTERDILNIMDKYRSVGLSVAVVKNNEIIYSKSYGKKNVETNSTIERQDIFRIASISKSFTATAIMQLIEAGKLNLDDDVSDLIGFKVSNPYFPNRAITLKMLLSHTSSINDKEGYFNLDFINPSENIDWKKCYNNYEPGSTYEYCNLNFNMLGTIVERISGYRFDKYIQEKILEPLDLYGGYYSDLLDSNRFITLYEYDHTSSKYNPSPAAYTKIGSRIDDYKMGYSTPIFSPTGGMKISANDLAIYMIMHMNKGTYKGIEIISRESSEEMQSAVLNNYGLALMTSENFIPNIIMKGHTGNAYGLYSAMFFQPKDNYGFVVITNGSDGKETNGMNNFLKSVMNSLYENLIKD